MTVVNDCRPSSLEQYRFVNSQFRRSEVLKESHCWSQGFGRATFLLEALEENPFPCLFQFLEAVAPFHLQSHQWLIKSFSQWIILTSICYDQPRQHIKKERHYFTNKGPSSQSYGFSSRRVWIRELESWAPKNWCFWTVVLEKTLENPLDCKEIQPVHPKRDQSWVFIGRTDAEAETPIVWPPDLKNWLIWKDPDAGNNWRGEEKGTTEDEMVRWYHWLNGHEFE